MEEPCEKNSVDPAIARSVGLESPATRSTTLPPARGTLPTLPDPAEASPTRGWPTLCEVVQ